LGRCRTELRSAGRVMKKAFNRTVAALLLLTASPAVAQGPLHVDITEGIASPLLIAIPEVASGAIPGTAGGEDTGVALARIVQADLLSTGLYRRVPVEGRFSVEQKTDFPPF